MLAMLLLVASSAAAQIAPVPDGLDTRTQTLTLPDDDVGRLIVLAGTGLSLKVPENERIDTVVLGDPGAYAIQVDSAARQLAIRALRPDAHSTLSLMTDARAYYLELEAGEGPLAASEVRLMPAPVPATLPQTQQMFGVAPQADKRAGSGVVVASYRLSGDRALRPLSVQDDGQVTTIWWGVDQALPAVFGVGPTGAEEVAEGNMRDGAWVLDRVWPRLVFRIDRARADARRIVRATRR